MASTETRKMVLAAAAACEDKKGENTRVLELDPADSGFTDFFLITSAANDRQAVAIGDEIELRLKREFGTYPNSVEGRKQGEWILIDYVDFVVHIFLDEKRAFYDLERLWKSAQAVDLEALKAALTEKVVASRKKSVAKKSAAKATPKKAAKSVPAKAKKAAAKKSPAKAPSKKTTPKK
ncbi:ribosome silencing factor [Acidobacterium sp. S8]|uniref:ribosome silencing factor n=1 Tax=Acidobacterium sp. S8 TaxID=1641854 RepID=UPI00131B477A|nr:ribosome silencing factor [Acidobacterium sp. S8]